MRKIIYIVIYTIISAFLGLFILPQKVETKRWIQLTDIPEDKLWNEISQDEQWPDWIASADSGNSMMWLGGTVKIGDVDEKSKTVRFEIDKDSGEGIFTIEQMPDGQWLSCYYSFQAEYLPWARLLDWMGRGELALEIDDSLQKIKKNLESK